jgi:hypothetical protein
MAIGNQTSYSITSLNTELGQVAVEMHNANNHANDFFERINKLGVAGLKNIGFDDATANAFFATTGQLNDAYLLWIGQIVKNPAFNFDDATAVAR